MQTYAEHILLPLGFNLNEKVDTDATFNNPQTVTLSLGHTEFVFTCVCPAAPQIRSLGCPVHHKCDDIGGSWPVERAREMVTKN